MPTTKVPRYSGIKGTSPYTGNFEKGFGDVMQGSVGGVFQAEMALEWSENLFEERLDQALDVCVENTKQYIKDIDLWDTGDLHDSIQKWEPRRTPRGIVGSFGVPLTYNGHEMDYAVYQEIGFRHTNGQWIQNEFMIHGLQRAKPEMFAIFTRGTPSTMTFDDQL